jgi:sugar/nucleoside kinase (ribokinase family)
MTGMSQSSRRGILATGIYLVDNVKIIDAWPEQDMLANISTESMSNGGGPYNVLKNLAALKADFPLEAAALLGDDAYAVWIREDCTRHGIDIRQVRTTRDAATSYTDAMCVGSDGRRTFFHQRGANALLSREHIDLAASNAKILLLGYLLLVDTLDKLDGEGRTEASRLFEQAREMGFITAVETASLSDPNYRQVVLASLRHADWLFCNEVEAGLILGEKFVAEASSLKTAAAKIAALGSPGRIVLHSTRGAVCREPDGTMLAQPSLKLPSDFIKGSTGAGDAFTAGFLHGVHEEADTATCLLQGVCVAAQSLTDPSPSDGVQPLAECMALAERYGFQEF